VLTILVEVLFLGAASLTLIVAAAIPVTPYPKISNVAGIEVNGTGVGG